MGDYLKKNQKSNEERLAETLVSEVENDFLSRRRERLLLERQWQVNVDFLTVSNTLV